MTDSGLGGIAALGINISVNPISGDYFADENGEVYFISEEPLSADRLMASEPRRVCRRLILVSYAAMGSVSRAA